MRTLFFQQMNLQKKLAIILVLFIFAPITIIGIFYNVNAQRYVSNQIDQDTSQTVTLVKENTDLLLQNYETQIKSIYQNEEIIRQLQANKTDIKKGNEEIYLFLRKFIRDNESIESIYLFPSRFNQLFFWDYKGSNYFIHQWKNHPEWQKSITKSNGKIVWIKTYRSPPNRYHSKNNYYFLGGFQIKNISNALEPLGTILFNVRTEAFDQIMNDIEVSKNGFILLVDPMGNIIWHRNTSIIGENIAHLEAFKKLSKKNQAFAYQKLNGIVYRVGMIQSKYNQWQYLSFIPTGDIEDKTKDIKKYTLIILLIIISIFSLLAWMLAFFITQPLRKLLLAMNKFDPTHLPQQLITNSKDEIGELHEAFNQLGGRIRQLVTEVQTISSKEKEAELRALQAQLNPHFIYNTLDTTNWMAIENNEWEISQMITSLGDIMRYTINQGNKWVSLAEEIEWVQKYVYIQKTRFEDRFQVNIELEELCLSCLIPHLLFQPFIENAIIHGMEDREGGGKIEIRAFTDSSKKQLFVQINDNGQGIRPETMLQIKQRNNVGIGIRNIHDRLQIEFGTEYGVEIKSEWGKGTNITITIPYLEIDRGEDNVSSIRY
ncbi:HAMP domain-containing protein [Seinonella peptonophila]|uniref:histidine kinase n=1 Tax=Seinonella peptonophila TaxID=112248 RepID=A0A1M4T529_9BACL|nr:sensor histidine kinase [Seinonella peptonophila]SHE39387.1 HAMP domain-containing protein [Seinonella peptonophila]